MVRSDTAKKVLYAFQEASVLAVPPDVPTGRKGKWQARVMEDTLPGGGVRTRIQILDIQSRSLMRAVVESEGLELDMSDPEMWVVVEAPRDHTITEANAESENPVSGAGGL